ncbi:MAG: nucleoside recognition domain-containing protein [Bacillota bacterium]
MIVLEVLRDGILAASGVVFRIAIIMFPVMVGLRILRDRGGLDWLTQRLSGVMGHLKLPADAAPIIAAGMVFGIVLASALLIKERERGQMSKSQMAAITVLLGCAHAFVEETAVFSSFGANPLIVVASRLTVASVAYTLIVFGPSILRTRLKSESAGE